MMQQVFYHCSITTSQLGFKPFSYFLLKLAVVAGFLTQHLGIMKQEYHCTPTTGQIDF
jgi:hypothetical protein